MNHGDALHQLDQLIQSRSILGHPFYQAWQRGELSRTQLAIYAKSYYPHVASFPGYLRLAIASASDAGVRTELEGNLSDELSNPAPHHELWLDFAQGVGLDKDTVSATVPTASTRRTVEMFHRLSNGETAGAVSALYAYESQQPKVSKTKMDGLRKFYGLSEARTLAYFEVHAEKDVEHSEGERQAMLRCLANGASTSTILDSAKTALDAYWNLLNGVCEEAGIKVEC